MWRIILILVLAPQPRLLVLDEPSSALDPPMQELLYTVLRERAAAGGTVSFSSHTLSEVDQLCDEVAIVRAGRLVAQATAKGVDLAGLSLAEMKSVEPRITREVFRVLTVEHSVAARTSLGGTAPRNVRRAVAAARRQYLGRGAR